MNQFLTLNFKPFFAAPLPFILTMPVTPLFLPMAPGFGCSNDLLLGTFLIAMSAPISGFWSLLAGPLIWSLPQLS
jgi:hypothetical protein